MSRGRSIGGKVPSNSTTDRTGALAPPLTDVGRPRALIKLDHLRIPVTDLSRSRDWYIRTLGLELEFEVPDRHTVALQETNAFTIFLQEVRSAVVPNQCALWFQVTDVDATFTDWSPRGVESAHGPRKSYWGYGVELADPDG